MSGACLLFRHLGQGRASHFLGLPGVSGVGQPLHGEHLAHLKGFCSGSWDWRMWGTRDTEDHLCRPPPPALGLLRPLCPQQPSFLSPGYWRKMILSQAGLSTGSGSEGRGWC